MREFNVADLNEDASGDYYYTVEETGGAQGFTVSYENNKGIKDSAKKGPIRIINRPNPVDIHFRKVDREGAPLAGVEFELRAGDGVQVLKRIKAQGSSAELKLDNLERGKVYYLVETQPLPGYSKPGRPWKITVDGNGGITVTGGDSKPIVPKSDSGDQKYYELVNYRIFKLPSTGGLGDYGFTISGVAVITATILMFLYRKRKEA